MKLKSDCFPYPVLNEELDDYLSSKFETKISTEITSNELILEFFFELDDDVIKELIDTNKANFVIHLEGESSSFRRKYVLDRNDFYKKIEIDPDELKSRKLQVNSMIVLSKNIESYANDNFNKTYYDIGYSVKNLRKGSILAFNTTKEIFLGYDDRDFSGLKSMIKVAVGKSEKEFRVELSKEAIIVYISDENYESYRVLAKNSMINKLLLNTIVLPALTYTLERVSTEKQEFEDHDWYDSLMRLMDNNNLDFEKLKNDRGKSLEYAQKLLNYPFENCLKEFKEIYNVEE